jgi:hypothetical protein
MIFKENLPGRQISQNIFGHIQGSAGTAHRLSALAHIVQAVGLGEQV